MQLYISFWDVPVLMPNHRKYPHATKLKNFRLPVAIDRWLKEKSRRSKIKQVDLVLNSLANQFPEVKKLLS